MKKLFIIELILIGILLIIGGIYYTQIKDKYNEYRVMIRDISGDNYAEEKKMNIIINDKSYSITLEDNDTVNDLINLLPLDITMDDLNDNEKYYYLDKNISSKPISYTSINKGDIMLFGNNCLVVFYKSFNTNYNYTKIGTINNKEVLDSLDNKSIKVRFERG